MGFACGRLAVVTAHDPALLASGTVSFRDGAGNPFATMVVVRSTGGSTATADLTVAAGIHGG